MSVMCVLRTGDRAGALAAFKESLVIVRALVKRDPENTQWRRDLTVSLNKVGEEWVAAGDRARALAAFEEVLAIRRGLVKRDPENTQWRLDVVVSLYKITTATTDAGKTRTALEEAVQILDHLAAQDLLPAAQQAWPGHMRKLLQEHNAALASDAE